MCRILSRTTEKNQWVNSSKRKNKMELKTKKRDATHSDSSIYNGLGNSFGRYNCKRFDEFMVLVVSKIIGM